MLINRKMYENVLENICEGVRFVTQMGQTFFWNRGAELITGFSRDEMVGALCEALHIVREEGKDSLCSHLCPLKGAREESEMDDVKVYLRHKEGHLVPVIMSVTPLMDDKGEKVGIAELFHDLTWNEEATDRIEQLSGSSLIDSLTEVGNRRQAEHTLKAKVEEYKRYGTRFGLALADVDNLKAINDTHGREAGDRMLQVISRSLSATLRPFDTICRWDSDEFIIFAANIRNDQNLMNVANRIRLLVEESSLSLEGGKLGTTVSVGALIARQEESGEEILNRARGLMNQSKSLGKNMVTMGREFIGTK